jgi:hypothetical protein
MISGSEDRKLEASRKAAKKRGFLVENGAFWAEKGAKCAV